LTENQILNRDIIMLSNKEIEQKLEELTIDESKWRQGAEKRRKNRSWFKLSARIAFRVLDELNHQGMTQVQLAEKMDITPQAVNKWLKGKENFTLESIFKFEKALGVTLLTVPKRTGIVIPRTEFNPKTQTYGSTKGVVEDPQTYQRSKWKIIEGGKAA